MGGGGAFRGRASYLHLDKVAEIEKELALGCTALKTLFKLENDFEHPFRIPGGISENQSPSVPAGGVGGGGFF